MSGYDLRYLEANLDILEQYLLSPILYWSPGINAKKGEPSYPMLTPGNLLLAYKKASVRASSEQERQQFQLAKKRFELILTKWRVIWSRKVAQEFHARLILWRNFLEEYREQPDNNYNRYPYEVIRRVQCQLLRLESKDIPSVEMDLLASLDKLLTTFFIPGNFIWESDLISIFPLSDFWYLYGSLENGRIQGN